MDTRFSYASVPTLAEFARSNAFIRGIMGPLGSGKSSAAAIELVRRGREQAPSTTDGVRRTRWVVVRNTNPQLVDTTIKTFFQWFPPEHFGRWHATDKSYEILAFDKTHIEILFRPLDEPDDIRKLLSLDLTGAWVNEAREVPWPIMDALQGRLGRYPPKNIGGPSWMGMWADTNPPDSDSRWYNYFEEEIWRKSFDELMRAGVLDPTMRPEDFAAIFTQPSGLSPDAENLPNLPAGYYQRLCIGKTQEWIKVYVHGRYGFVTDNKTVFPEFNERVHVKPLEPIPGRTIYRGWDFGLTPAMTLSQILPDGRWLTFDELVAEGMGVDRFGDQALEHCSRSFRGQASFEDIGDPAGMTRAETDEKTCYQILESKGINVQPGLQTLQIRLESIRKPLTTLVGGEPQFVLHPRCKMLRKGFLGGYHYRRLSTNTERYSDKPEKNEYSHPMDSLEYVGTILFGGGLTAGQMGDNSPRQPRSEQGRSSVTGY